RPWFLLLANRVGKLSGNFMTNRQSVDASVCVSVHVVAKCRPSKLDAAARPTPTTETAAVIVLMCLWGAIDETQTGFTMDIGYFVRPWRRDHGLCPKPVEQQDRCAG